MFYSALLTYIRNMLSYVPMSHWVSMGAISLFIALSLMIGRKRSVYSSIVLGFTVFVGLFLLEEAVVIRYCDILHHATGVNLEAEHNRIFHGNVWGWTEIFSNLFAFIPFGLFLSEFLASTKSVSAGRRLGLVTLAGFGLSLTIECLQLLLHVGFFELTDLVMNTVGAIVGALVSAGVRKGVAGRKSRVIGEGHV